MAVARYVVGEQTLQLAGLAGVRKGVGEHQLPRACSRRVQSHDACARAKLDDARACEVRSVDATGTALEKKRQGVRSKMAFDIRVTWARRVCVLMC